MNFSHYSDRPVALAADLVNTERSSGDEIGTAEGLAEFLERYRELWEGAARPLEASELDSLRRLRGRLRDVFRAPDDETAAESLNLILTNHGAVPRVSVHSGPPHLHFEPLDASMCSWLGTVTAMGLATVVVEHGVDRFGVCAASDCDDVFVDTSRNRSRKHCSTTCSTRSAVTAYRARQRS